MEETSASRPIPEGLTVVTSHHRHRNRYRRPSPSLRNLPSPPPESPQQAAENKMHQTSSRLLRMTCVLKQYSHGWKGFLLPVFFFFFYTTLGSVVEMVLLSRSARETIYSRQTHPQYDGCGDGNSSLPTSKSSFMRSGTINPTLRKDAVTFTPQPRLTISRTSSASSARQDASKTFRTRVVVMDTVTRASLQQSQAPRSIYKVLIAVQK